MKRPPKSFIVEHKRRSRSATFKPTSIWGRVLDHEVRAPVRNADEHGAVTQRRENSVDRPLEATTIGGDLPPPRILQAHDATPPVSGMGEAAILPRPRGRPRKPVTLPTDEQLSMDHGPTLVAQPDDSAPAAPLPATRPSFKERRRAARKALPLGERWKWNLKY
ncbi:hypothetical protein LDO31_14875 [Luteimonas sp. XNQY3]|nr:hypothetical protein [Luteimonas sp. XNQY3]MCD9007501.1 hypothetical protein [Luteimonas sp. XNQY3]